MEIRRARADEAAALGLVCGRAFFDDDGAVFTEPDPSHRLVALAEVFEAIARDAIARGEAWTTDDLAGIATWAPPGRVPVRDAEADVVVALGADALVRLERMVSTFGRVRAAADGIRAWHLELLGVDPLRQGRGIATALVGPGHRRADERGERCYLETFGDRNVRFYARFGYALRSAERIPGTSFVVSGLVREPGTPRAGIHQHDA